MNSMIGKSTGIALLMAAALLAALFAMGVFSPAGVGATVTSSDTSKPKVTLSSYAPAATGVTLTAVFQVSAGGDTTDDDDHITITLADGFVQDDAGDDTSTAKATQVINGVVTEVGTPGAATTDIFRLNPDDRAATTGDDAVTATEDLVADQDVTVTWTNLTNPPQGVHKVTFDQTNSDPDPEVNVAIFTQSSKEPGAVVGLKLSGKVTEDITTSEEIKVTLADFDLSSASAERKNFVITQVGNNPATFNPDVSISGNTVTLTMPSLNLAGDTYGENTPAVESSVTSGVYTVWIKEGAGIKNPSIGGAYNVVVDNGTTATTDDTTNVVMVNRTIKLDKTSGVRGTVTTITGKGFTSDRGVTVYLETVSKDTADDPATADVNEAKNGGTPSGTQISVGSASVVDGTFTLPVDTSSIDFITGTWTDSKGNKKGRNSFTATDGNNKSADVRGYFQIKGKVTLGETSASHSEVLKISLADWTDTAIGRVTIGGVLAATTAATGPTFKKADGTDAAAPEVNPVKKTATLYVQIPATARTGNQTVAVYKNITTAVASGTATVDVGVLSLDADPVSAVRGQKVTVTGGGFSGEGVAVTGIEVGATGSMVPVTDTLSKACEIRSGGQLYCEVTIPVNDISVRDGENTIKVTATGGRVGQAMITVPEASIELSHTESRRGTTLEVTGKGFLAGELVSVTYAGDEQVSERADKQGDVTASFSVPADDGNDNALILGKEYDVVATATKTVGDADVTVSAKAKHSTPKPVITSDPMEATLGSEVTIMGENLPLYATVQTIMIGSTDVTPAPKPATDSDGSFTVKNVLVPQLTIGRTSAVKVTIGGVQYDGEIRAIEAPVVAVPDPSIEIDTASGAAGSTITVTGMNFPAGVEQVVRYGGNIVTGVTPDADGNISVTITVPADAAAGAMMVTVGDAEGVTHTVVEPEPEPEPVMAEVMVNPAEATVGDMITISGSNMAANQSVIKLSVGDASVLPAGLITDTEGSFSVEVAAPDAEGEQTITAVVAGSDPVTGMVTIMKPVSTDPAEVFAGVNGLTRAWHLDAETQNWTFYDPDAELFANVPEDRKLSMVASGQVYTLIVSEAGEFQGKALFVGTNQVYVP